MGPSGSGKSTLLNLVAGLDRPTSGTVTVGGIALAGLSEAELARFRRSHIGFVFQFFHLLNDLGIGAKAREYPAKRSGGERQRVAIARALINRPAVVLADEPTGALDTSTGEQVMELLVALNQRGQTILLASHDLKLAGRYTRRIINLRDGKMTADSQPLDTGRK